MTLALAALALAVGAMGSVWAHHRGHVARLVAEAELREREDLDALRDDVETLKTKVAHMSAPALRGRR